MVKKIFLIVIILTALTYPLSAKSQKDAYKNDYLYSEAYFDYLIECAEIHKENEHKKEKPIELDLNEQVVAEDLEPFKLRVENDNNINPYKESFKKVDSKTIIPVNDNFSFIQNTAKTRNKYNSNDYKILMGAEFAPYKSLVFSTGLETNYRGIDQNPTSRKLYLTPTIHINDIFSLSFHNKVNVQTYSTDHDIGLNISPFKSKVMDFGVYAGLTRNQSGSHSESINFSTNLYFF